MKMTGNSKSIWTKRYTIGKKTESDLREADLSRANLSGADLSDLDLRGTDLRREERRDSRTGPDKPS